MRNRLSKNAGKVKIPGSFHISSYEKHVVLKRLEKAVQKLKEARREIRQGIQEILRMKEAGDDIADQAVAAANEASFNDDNPWILSTSTKAYMITEAAKPLLLLRSD